MILLHLFHALVEVHQLFILSHVQRNRFDTVLVIEEIQALCRDFKRRYPRLRLELEDLIFCCCIVVASITCKKRAIRVNRSRQSCVAVVFAFVVLVGLILLLWRGWLRCSDARVLPGLLAEL